MSEDNVLTPEEEAELATIQTLRHSLIKDLAPEGKAPAKGQVFLLGLLDGADRLTLSKAKLRAQSKRDADVTSVVKMAGQMLRGINARTYRPPAPASKREIPEEHARRTYVPGELEIGSVDPITIGQVIGA